MNKESRSMYWLSVTACRYEMIKRLEGLIMSLRPKRKGSSRD